MGSVERHCKRIASKKKGRQRARDLDKASVPAIRHGTTTGRPATGSAKRNAKHHKRAQTTEMSASGPLRDMLLSAIPDANQLEDVKDCLGHVQILARQLLGETAAVVVQGSYAQGLALRTSDLDVAVIIGEDELKLSKESKKVRKRAGSDSQEASPDGVQRAKAAACLRELAAALATADLPEIRIAMRIFTARVPVLRLHCGDPTRGKTVVDVSVGSSLLRGACDRCVYAVLEQDPSGCSAALCRLIKIWAKRRRLTDTLRGGLSSFALVLMTIFFLQSSRPSPSKGPMLLPHRAITGSRPEPADREEGCPEPLEMTSLCSHRELGLLLLGFFTWADEELPKLRGRVLSVATAKSEPLQGSSAKPLVVEVPFSSCENAARCLRPDVWEKLVRPEFARGRRLSQQIIKGEAGSKAVKLLFAAAGGAVEKEASAEGRGEQQADQDMEFGTLEREEQPMESEAAFLPEPTSGRGRKRRRASKPPFPKLRPANASEDALPKPVAPVERWLGLRSLLAGT